MCIQTVIWIEIKPFLGDSEEKPDKNSLENYGFHEIRSVCADLYIPYFTNTSKLFWTIRIQYNTYTNAIRVLWTERVWRWRTQPFTHTYVICSAMPVQTQHTHIHATCGESFRRWFFMNSSDQKILCWRIHTIRFLMVACYLTRLLFHDSQILSTFIRMVWWTAYKRRTLEDGFRLRRINYNWNNRHMKNIIIHFIT